MISAQRIEYRGYSSVDFDLITCLSFESDDGEVNSFLTREAVASESFIGGFKRIHQFKYTETFSPKVTFIKDGFGDFTTEEVRRILRWLTGGANVSFLTVYNDDSNVIHFEILGGFSEVSLYKLGNGRVVGIVAKFESTHPYALSPLKTITKDVSNPTDNSITININTDEPEKAIYPCVTIQQGDSVIVNVDRQMINNNKWVDDEWMDGTIYYYAEGNDGAGEYYYNQHTTTVDANGSTVITVIPTAQATSPLMATTSVIIKNTYVDDDNVTHIETLRLANNTSGENIILDGANRVISSSSTTRIFGDDFIGWSWLPMYNGTNVITVLGNCTVTLKYREPRKIGEL